LRPRVFAIAAAVVMAALFALDTATGNDIVFVPGYVLGPLIVALLAGPRPTAAVGVVATALGLIGLVQDGDFEGQDVIRIVTVAAGSALAVWIAALRARLQRSNTSLGEALGLLDVVFAHAPVGIALLDRDLRVLRVNDRLAEIAGARGDTIEELLPDLPGTVREDAARVIRTGTSLSEVEISGAERRWIASYWPVRRDGETIGVGLVLADVTERRAAERALREQTDRYEALLHALSEAGEGLLVLESDGRCLYANSAFEQLSGYTFPELTAMETVLDLVGELDRIEGRIVPRTLRRRDGGIVDLEVGRTSLDIEGSRQHVVVVRDVTARLRAEAERERLLARAALLAEASELFDRSLDEELTLRRVAQLCVRDIAASCVIVVGESPERVRGIVAATHEAEREGELMTSLLRDPVAEPLAEVMRGARGLVAATPPGLGTARSVIVPLRARGRAHGVLAAGFDDLASGSDAEALALFEDLGRRAALALDNARLYEERDQVARTLQRSLLPGALPDIPGVELAGRYVAAGDGNEVGGDFYDCFPTGGGDWALVIGDVCGKGAEAATLTALARYTVRAASQHTRRPRAIVLELNEALLRQQLGYRFCTVLYVSLTPRDGGVSACVATGGHPLPMVVRGDGTVETVGSPGSLVGILEDPDVTEDSVELAPGDALVLVTDGVTEATAVDRATGPGRLAALLADHAGSGAEAIAEAVERDAIESQGGAPRDDVAVLVARALEGGSFAGETAGVAAAT
jgi:PAS domain S-box-containing protein